MAPEQPFQVAAIQAAPVFLDRDATVEKACGLIATAARAGARLIVFPEAFVPGYPDWVWLLPPRERAAINDLYAELVANAVDVPGPATERLGRAGCSTRPATTRGRTCSRSRCGGRRAR